jgi:hypothetical protein
MDRKPQSLSMREWLARKIAPKLLISEHIVDAVISHQFSEANAALDGNNSIEISGFGKFFFNEKKAIKKFGDLDNIRKHYLGVLADSTISETKRATYDKRLVSVEQSMESLKPKLNEYFSNLRRMEEQTNSSSSHEECNRNDECSEDEDLRGV